MTTLNTPSRDGRRTRGRSPASTDTGLSLRLPPHSIEAEQSLLGGLLLDNQAWPKVGDLVTERDFYRDDHRRIAYQHLHFIPPMSEAERLYPLPDLDWYR